MNSDAWMLLLLFLLTLGLLAWPLGQLLTRLIEGELPRPLLRLERLCLERLCLGAATEEMDWRRYAGAILVFNLLGAACCSCCYCCRESCRSTPSICPDCRSIWR